MKKEDQEFVELVENFSNGLDQFHRANPITPESKVGCFLLATYEDTMQTAVCCTGDQLYVISNKKSKVFRSCQASSQGRTYQTNI